MNYSMTDAELADYLNIKENLIPQISPEDRAAYEYAAWVETELNSNRIPPNVIACSAKDLDARCNQAMDQPHHGHGDFLVTLDALLENLQRVSKRGLTAAQQAPASYDLDLWQHVLDTIEQMRACIRTGDSE